MKVEVVQPQKSYEDFDASTGNHAPGTLIQTQNGSVYVKLFTQWVNLTTFLGCRFVTGVLLPIGTTVKLTVQA